MTVIALVIGTCGAITAAYLFRRENAELDARPRGRHARIQSIDEESR